MIRYSYSEVIDLLYAGTTFCLSLETTRHLVFIVPSHHLVLTNIQLVVGVSLPIYLPSDQWPLELAPTQDDATRRKVRAKGVEWEAFWRQLSKLTVRSLFVEFRDYRVSVPEEKLLAPLRAFKAEIFEAFLPRADELNRAGILEGLNIVIRRPPDGMDLTMHLDVAKYNTGTSTGTPFWKRSKEG